MTEHQTVLALDTGTEELLCEIHRRVAVVTLNKPNKKNALGDILTPALRAILVTLEARQDVGCIMLTGAGKAFCAGGDVSEMGQGRSQKTSQASIPADSRQEKIDALAERERTLTGRLYHLSKPTVAALPGPAAGAGLSIALACDLRIAADDAFFLTAFKNIGLSGDYGATWFLPRLVGLSRAKSAFFRSERIGAKTALAIGLADEIFPADDFQYRAFEYCAEIAAGPPQALARIKRNLQQGLEQSLEASLQLEAEHMIDAMGSEEAKEAIAAFVEKRAPIFNHGDE